MSAKSMDIFYPFLSTFYCLSSEYFDELPIPLELAVGETVGKTQRTQAYLSETIFIESALRNMIA